MGGGRGEGRYASGLGRSGATNRRGAQMTNVGRAARQNFDEIKVSYDRCDIQSRYSDDVFLCDTNAMMFSVSVILIRGNE